MRPMRPPGGAHTYNNYFAISKHLVTVRNASIDLLHPRNQEHISYRSPVIANFLSRFSHSRYCGNRGWSETNFTYTVKFTDPKNPLRGARIRYRISVIANFVKIFIAMAIEINFTYTVKFADAENPRLVQE